MISAPSRHRSSRRLLALASLALCSALPLKADMIQLVNGDHYRGTVISMTTNIIEFQSEIQGRVKLPRDKVAQINLRDVVARPVVGTNAAPASAPAPASIILSGPTTRAATAPVPAPASQADAVVQQMRQQGIQPQLINQVQQQIFGKASPEAAQKFDEIMGGLMSGQISVQDLRAQAQASIKQARDAKKDLGGDAGEMLDGYISILEKFVSESSTPTPVTRAPAAGSASGFSATHSVTK